MQDGTIKYEIKLTGELSTNPLSFGEESPEYGTLVMKGVNAQHHQHMFCARLDMAVDDEEGGKGLYVSEVKIIEHVNAVPAVLTKHVHVVNGTACSNACILSYAELCCAGACCVMLCWGMPCHAVLCCAGACCAEACCTMLCCAGYQLTLHCPFGQLTTHSSEHATGRLLSCPAPVIRAMQLNLRTD